MVPPQQKQSTRVPAPSEDAVSIKKSNKDEEQAQDQGKEIEDASHEKDGVGKTATPPSGAAQDEVFDEKHEEAGISEPAAESKLKEQAQDVAPTPRARDEDETPEESRPEIKTIMEQFTGEQAPTASAENTTSPSGSTLPIFQYPKRGSSLENRGTSPEGQPNLPGTSSTGNAPTSHSHSRSIASPTVVQPPLPEPEPEPDLPFDFHRFLEQLRHRTADPVAKFLRSFLQEFGKRQWMVHEQTKIISDFLSFISRRMAQCDVWRTVSDAEFDNAKEGMEKLVMNRLYTQTFAPEIPPLSDSSKTRRRNAGTAQLPGRKGQHQEDVERDEVLGQKMRIYGWVKEEHLDIKPFDEKGHRLLRIAQQELNKIRSYRAPRDKVICVLNTCKVLFGFLRTSKSEQSADAFIPLLIYTVLKANPEHLVSNVQYILRFRNPDKLSGEAGYYMSSLMGAVQFIEHLDKTSLTVSDEDFERNVEQAVSAIAERRSREERRSSLPFHEKALPSQPEVTPRHSSGAERVSPRRRERSGLSNTINAEQEDDDANPAVAGLLRTIQKPFSTIGRIFSDESEAGPASTPQPGSSPSTSSIPLPPSSERASKMPPGQAAQQVVVEQAQKRMAAEEAAARQASAETAEAQRVARAEHETVVETLSGMFPDLDRDIISDVVRMKEARVGLAVDACLALTRS